MKLALLTLLSTSLSFFQADCPVMEMAQSGPDDPEPVCIIVLADCAVAGGNPQLVFGSCGNDLCSCMDSACDCPAPDDPDDPNPIPDPMDPDGPSGPSGPDEPSGPNDPANPEGAPSVEQTEPTVKPLPLELGQPRTFDGRVLRPNQKLEAKTIRLKNEPNSDPTAAMVKAIDGVDVEYVTSVRFSPGTFFSKAAFYGLYELKTSKPIQLELNGKQSEIPAGKIFHVAFRLQEEPARLNNAGHSYRALVKSNSQDSPQEGVITVGDTEYHAIGAK